jgi:uncharacterized membrane protein
VAGVPRTTEKLLQRLERAKVLDGTADFAARLLRPVIRPGVVEDTLTGKQLGHPAHPAVVAVPIGAWTLTHVFDATGDTAAASRAQAVGILAALPAAATGASDWLTTLGAERRVGLVHAALNYTALSLHVASWLQRRKGRDRTAALLAVSATSLVGVSGWLGGHLAYALGVGVDTTAFQHFPGEWVDAVGVDEVPATGLHRAEVAAYRSCSHATATRSSPTPTAVRIAAVRWTKDRCRTGASPVPGTAACSRSPTARWCPARPRDRSRNSRSRCWVRACASGAGRNASCGRIPSGGDRIAGRPPPVAHRKDGGACLTAPILLSSSISTSYLDLS